MNQGNKYSLPEQLPALRVLLPFVAGVVCARFLYCSFAAIALIVVAIALYAILWWKWHSPADRMKLRNWRLPLLAIVIMSVAMIITRYSMPSSVPDDIKKNGALAGRIDAIKIGDKSMDLRVKLLGHCDKKGQTNDLSGNNVTVKLTTRGCDYTLDLGDIIVWTADLQPIRNLGNPAEVDYASIERNRGVIYTQHVNESQWQKIGSKPTWLNRMARLRDKAETAILGTSLEQPVQEFIIALLLGNDDFISQELRHEFSIAGVAHLLALSGLHVGILSMVVYFLFFPLDYIRMKRLRVLLSIIVMVAFALFTGLSASVVRATVMMALLMAPMLLHRRSEPLNSLAVAALVILVFNPQALFSAGFQLSFTTVAFILLCSRWQREFLPERKWVALIFTTVSTTVIATLSTMALSAYYFNTLSFGGSIIANLIILPLFPLFMIVAVVFMGLALMNVEISFVNETLRLMYESLLWIVRQINSLGLYLEAGVEINVFTVIVFYILLIALVFWLYTRKRVWLYASLSMLPLILCFLIYNELSVPKRGMVVFNSYDSTPILYFNNGYAWLWEPDRITGVADVEEFKSHHRAFLAKYHIDSIKAIDTAEVVVQGAVFKSPFAMVMGKKMFAAGAGHWKRARRVGEVPSLDMVIVTKRFHGTITRLNQLFPGRKIVLAGDIYEGERPRFINECDSLHLRYYDMDLYGAITDL